MKKYDVTALGELLVDMTENGISPQGNRILEANPGGAPCNVLAMLSKLGKKTAFIGKVGDDSFGRMLRDTAGSLGICTDGLASDSSVHTTLAFIHNYENGERDFSFFRDPGADMMLRADEVREDLIRDCRVFHFGSLSMTDEPCRTATKGAVSLAKDSGAVISFDPNLREPLWKSLDAAKEQIGYGISVCDVLKIADNEACWFMEESDPLTAALRLRGRYGTPLVLLTLGREGSAVLTDSAVIRQGGCRVDAIDATGAGDTFMGCILSYISETGLSGLSEDRLREMLRFANAAAAIVTTRKGALKVMPGRDEIAALLNAQPDR